MGLKALGERIMLVTEDRPPLDGLPLDSVLEIWVNMLLWSGLAPTVQHLVHADITFSESVVLRMLQRTPLNVADVASCISITQSAASRVVDRLVHDGYVSRQENPDDRRQKQMMLTEKGKGLIETIESVFVQTTRPILETLSPAEAAQFRSLLVKMIVAQGACPLKFSTSPPDPELPQPERAP
jgi:DNA-binding MarR family transcriptional regulator